MMSSSSWDLKILKKCRSVLFMGTPAPEETGRLLFIGTPTPEETGRLLFIGTPTPKETGRLHFVRRCQ